MSRARDRENWGWVEVLIGVWKVLERFTFAESPPSGTCQPGLLKGQKMLPV